MKSLKTAIALIFALLACQRSRAQQITISDCLGAIPVCQSVYVSNAAPVDAGGIADLTIDNQDCLSSGEHLTAWYLINVVSSGVLEFTITPPVATDYDFALWDITGNPILNQCLPTGCDNIKNTLPVRCNYAGTQGPTGISAAGTCASCNAGDPPFCTALNVTAGQTLILVVDNFTQSTAGYTLDFSASTASIFDQRSPQYKSVRSKCGFESSILELTMSELVMCNSVDADGSDFVITPNPGNVQVISAEGQYCTAGAQFTSSIALTLSGSLPPGNYILNSRRGNSGNRLIDACQNEQATGDNVSFTILPNPNPLGVKTLLEPACIKTQLELTQLVRCNTISPDGSDFVITGPDKDVKVISATPINCRPIQLTCSTEVMTESIALTFNKSIFYPGTYTLSVTSGNDLNELLDTCGSSAFKSFDFVVSDKGGVDAVATTNALCEPGYTFLNGEALLPPSLGGYNYQWTPSTFVYDTTKANTMVYVPRTTSYAVQILDIDECYRRDTVEVIVSELKPLIEPLTDTSICVGESFKVTASGGVEYKWWPENGISCTYCTDITVAPLQSTTYSVTVKDQYGCSEEAKLYVNVDPLPVVYAGEDTSVYYGDEAMLYAHAPGGLYYSWTPVFGLITPNEPNTYARPEQGTRYVVKVADTNGCISKDDIYVDLRQKTVYVPSAFSPNGDGRNDVFRVANLSYERIQEFRVFNRWGQEVFTAYDNKTGWDGSFNGKPGEIGTYRYLIRVAKPDGNSETFRGDVTLVR